MKLITPAYYPAFYCIAGDCRHSCCIGWEIDIDESTAAKYRTYPGNIGDRMRAQIDFSADPPHFVLQGDEERCPFLNERGLCDIILSCGEGALCQICTDHPRFRNFYSDRTEMGLGLCCEAAASLVLGYDKPLALICLSDDGTDGTPTEEESAFFELRQQLFSLLQNREVPIAERFEQMLTLVGAGRLSRPMADMASFLSELEILDTAWEQMLSRIGTETMPLPGNAAEQLTSYLLMRHLPKVLDGEEPWVIVSFAVFAHDLIAALFAKTDGTFDALCETVRLFSSEIEYSEENLFSLFDEIASS